MSIELEKVVQIYQQCEALLQSKVELMSIISVVSREYMQPRPDFDFSPSIVQANISKIVESWFRKLSSYKDFEVRHIRCASMLKLKSENIKNNTQLLSKESQLITEIEDMIENWNHKQEVAAYYDIKNRKNFKKALEAKLTQIRDSESKTEESMAPLFAHKLEKQIKDIITQLFYEETVIDRETMDYVATVNNDMCKKLQKFGRDVQEMQPISTLSEMANRLFSQNYQALERKNKLTQNCFHKYFQSLSIVIKKIMIFWQTFMKTLNDLVEEVENTRLHFLKLSENLDETENKIYKLLEDIPDSLGSVFRVEIVYEMIKILQKTFEISKVLEKLKGRVQKIKQSVERNEKYARDYSQNLLKQHSARSKNFHEFVLKDKKFLEEMGKGQKSINLTILHNFKDFLLDGFNLLKEVRKIYTSDVKFHEIQSHKVAQIVGKLIITSSSHSSNITMNSQSEKDVMFSSRMSTRLNTLQTNRKKQKSEKNEKIRKVEEFLEKFVIFKDLETKECQYFSCALGPKLLLHGKIYILEQGIYYESFFNKKNLFFGKTKLYIPKQDIVEIDEKNTLMIFPDAVQIRTVKGVLYFHALTARKHISSSLIEAYFPQNIEEGDNITEVNFKHTELSQAPQSDVIARAQAPLETMMEETVIKGIRLNVFFRRYLSDDKFQIRGKIYSNFKCYYLQQIQAIDPSSQPMIPDPPSYFCYQNQQSCENTGTTSERMHTYKKKIPKIPFVSSGGHGHCEEKQVYHWVSPTLLYISIISVVKGFSLTEGMEIQVKQVYKEVSDGVKVSISGQIRFSTNSSTNALLRAPAMSNLKDASLKMFQIIQKYEKGKKMMGGNKRGTGKNEEEIEYLKEKVQLLQKQNKMLSLKWKAMALGFLFLYLLTILSFSFIF